MYSKNIFFSLLYISTECSNRNSHDLEALEEVVELEEQMKGTRLQKYYVNNVFIMMQRKFSNQLQSRLQIQVKFYLRRLTTKTIEWPIESIENVKARELN